MFESLVGNNHAKQVLSRLVRSGRMPNSLLFAGTDGVGKREFALEIARVIVCTEPDEEGACYSCMACMRLNNFEFPFSDKKEDHEKIFFTEHPDVGVILPHNRNILVAAIRELEREAFFRPYEAKARIFIIDDADKMNDAASNALLKTLEEPASSTYLFLISSRPDSMLQTIHSRCQVIRFAGVDCSEIEQHILKGQKFSPSDAALIAKLCAGSVGRALSFDIEKFYSRRELMLGVLNSAVTNSERSSLLQTAETISDAKNKDSFEESLELLQALARDVWILSVGGDTADIVNFDLAERLKAMAGHTTSTRLAGWISEIELLRESLLVNVNKKVAASALFTQMSA